MNKRCDTCRFCVEQCCSNENVVGDEAGETRDCDHWEGRGIVTTPEVKRFAATLEQRVGEIGTFPYNVEFVKGWQHHKKKVLAIIREMREGKE